MEELEQFFLEKVKPYEERIRKLEEAERQKEFEITTLKHAVHNLNRIVEDLKAKQTGALGATRATGTTAKTGLSKFFIMTYRLIMSSIAAAKALGTTTTAKAGGKRI